MSLNVRIRPFAPLGACLLALAAAAAFLLPLRGASSDTPAAGNGFYRVFVEDDPEDGDGLGTFSVATGPSHPAGGGLSLLSGGSDGAAGRSFLTVRSYSTGTDYVQAAAKKVSPNLTVGLNGFAELEAAGTTGYRTAYRMPGPLDTPEALEIVSELTVAGDSFAGSAVAITTTITNADSVPLRVGLRYLLDLDVAGDDGPLFVAGNPAQPLATETVFGPPAFPDFRAQPNGVAPALSLVGVTSAATDAVTYAHWPDAFATAFDYTATGLDVATDGGLDDAAVLLYFGATEAEALALAPGESVTLSVSLFATAPPTGPEDCDNGADDDGDRLTGAADPDCATPTPPPSASPSPSPTPAAFPRTGADTAAPGPAGRPAPR